MMQKDDSIIQSSQQVLPIMKESSHIVKYHSFGILSVKESIWTPETQKSIFITAVQASSPLPVSILLSDGDDTFVVLSITDAFATVSQHFSSPCELKINNPLMLSTINEKFECNVFGAVSAAQVNYNNKSDFNNVNNAVGLANGSLASLNSALIIQTAVRIILNYNMLPSGYDYLEIERVVIKYYCRLSLTVAVGVSSMILYWRANPQENWIELQQTSLALIGIVNYLTNPTEFDITNAILEAPTPWDAIDSLQTLLDCIPGWELEI